jgi:hypothetical protein
VGAQYWAWTNNYRYDAQTGELVGREVTDDTGSCAGVDNVSAREGAEAYGAYPGNYGEYAPDCNFTVPPECYTRSSDALDAGDGGPLDAAVDASAGDCILTP